MENNMKILEFSTLAELRKEKLNPLIDNEDRPCIELEHIESGSGRLLDWTKSSGQKSIKNVFYKGDILFGKLRPYLRKYWLAEFNGVCSSEIWVLMPKISKVDPKYFFYRIQNHDFIMTTNVSSGSKMPRADWNFIINYPLSIIHSIPEQRAIATCLSTWDNAIQQLTELIAQKELRKKWLMQMLLTGKKRMTGLKAEWAKIGAGEIFKSVSFKGFTNEVLLSATQDRGMIPRTMLEGRVTMPTTGTEGFKLVDSGDFVISLRSFQGGLEYSYYKGLVSPAYTVLKPRKPINQEFYKQYFKSDDFIGHLSIAVIGIRDGKQISYDDFCVVKIPYPSLEEQTAIAKVLQAADKEISLLKAKAEKLRDQKKGMMQVLLTGKKRIKLTALVVSSKKK
jgi:type I restriction enzyme S subunit